MQSVRRELLRCIRHAFASLRKSCEPRADVEEFVRNGIVEILSNDTVSIGELLISVSDSKLVAQAYESSFNSDFVAPFFYDSHKRR